MFSLALLWFAHLIILVLGAALLLGWIKFLKARMQNRRGPGILQPVRDLHKWFRKDSIISSDASWLSQTAPYLCCACIFTAGLMLPIFTWKPPFSFSGDTFIFIYLLAAARWITALAAMDSGSHFTGMGASRELAISVVVEPALLFSLLPSILAAGSSRLEIMFSNGWGYDLTSILAAFAFLLVILAETGRIPVDNPDTHLELTMIHEGMMLEYSGRYLALMNVAIWMKQFILCVLAAHLFFPTFGWIPMWAEIFIKVSLIGTILAVIETSNAKMRLYRIPRFIGTSILLSIMALGVYFVH